MSRKRTILLVDDDSDFIQLAGELFNSSGFKVVKANSATAAINILINKKARIDIIISDLNMPDRSGMDLLKAVRMIGLETPFYILTANQTFTEREAKLAGATGLFRKTILYKPLINAVKKSVQSPRTPSRKRRLANRSKSK